MTSASLNIPGIGERVYASPAVIIGPNGSGKTRFAQLVASHNNVSVVSAQRRTWVDDNLPVQEEQQLKQSVRSHTDRWRQHSWQPTEEINFVISTMIQEHTNRLTKLNEEALAQGTSFEPVRDTHLMTLQEVWTRLFPFRKLEVSGFFPKVRRLDAEASANSYSLREMSDGERTVLYMAARILTAEHQIILVDEPELHMHSRLAVEFWNEAEKLRPDCAFIYVTHDLNFALSRREGTLLIVRPGGAPQELSPRELPASVAVEVLGAATLPFHAKRVFLYEGEAGKGFASAFFDAWFDDPSTFAIPAGNRASVSSAVAGLHTVGVAAAKVQGLVDRDFYADTALAAVPDGVAVLRLHEVESLLCERGVVAAVAQHLGKDPDIIWRSFLDRVRKEYRVDRLNHVISCRVRARIGDLLDRIFDGSQVVAGFDATVQNHSDSMAVQGITENIRRMFDEEKDRVEAALASGDEMLLAILPGKPLMGLMSSELGFRNSAEYSDFVVRALTFSRTGETDSMSALGLQIEAAMMGYLPPRHGEAVL